MNKQTILLMKLVLRFRKFINESTEEEIQKDINCIIEDIDFVLKEVKTLEIVA